MLKFLNCDCICIYSDEWELEVVLLVIALTELYCDRMIDIYNFCILAFIEEYFVIQHIFSPQSPILEKCRL